MVAGMSEKYQTARQQVQSRLQKQDQGASQASEASQALLGPRGSRYRAQRAQNGDHGQQQDDEEPAPDKRFPLPMLHSDNDRREFICAGAAAGIAVRLLRL